MPSHRPRFLPMSGDASIRPIALTALCVLFAVFTLEAPGPSSRAAAQEDLTVGWRTLAHGDEVLMLAIDPEDEQRVLAGTEGGGLIEWLLGGSGSKTWPIEPIGMRQFIRPQVSGLGSNTIHDIAFSPRDGSVWLATERGVTRAPADLDPDGWQTWSETEGMPPTWVFSAVVVADDGTVWAGTPGAGLARRALDGTWTTFTEDDLALDDEEEREGPGSMSISDLLFDADGTLWVIHGRGGTSGLAASKYFPATNEWRHLLAGGPRTDPRVRPRTGQLMKMALDHENGHLWIASWGRGAYRFDGTSWAEFGPEDGVCDTTLWAIAAKAGEAWVACGESARELGGGVAHFDGALWRSFDKSSGLPTDIVTSIALLGDAVLLATDGPSAREPWVEVGIQPIVMDSEAVEVGVPLQTRSGGLLPPENEITALMIDDAGLVWVGTRGAGLFWREIESTGPWQTLTESDGLAGNTVTDIAFDDSSVWVAATSTRFEDGRYADGGVTALVREGGFMPSVTLKPAPEDVPSGQISSVAALPDGRVAVSIGSAAGGPGRDPHDGRGLAIYDPEGVSWEYFDYAWTSGGLSGDTVLDLEVSGEELWAATSYFRDARRELQPVGGGVSAWNGETWSAWGDGDEGFTAYSQDLIRGDVRAIQAGPDGTVWAGAWHADEGSLIGLWPYVDAVVQAFDDARWSAKRFPGQGWVSAVEVDAHGRVWAATTRGARQEAWPARGVRGEDDEGFDAADGGLRVLAGSEWTSLHEGNSGLGARAITALAVDPETGDLWAGSESGGLLVRDAEGESPTPAPRPTPLPRPTLDPTTIQAIIHLPAASR